MNTPADDDTDRRQGSLLSRRHLVISLGAGSAFLATGAAAASLMSDDDDDGADDDDDHGDHGDNSGRGRGRGRGRGGDDDDTIVADGEVPAGSVEVQIVDDDPNGFSPGTVTIDVGQSVTWVNLDDDIHTATTSAFDTGILQPGQLATITFDQAGAFPYSCQIHPEMTGIVDVRGGSAATPDQATPGSASPAAASGDTSTVTIREIAFDPPNLRITPGTTVTWTNTDPVSHTATSNDGAFDTGVLDQGQTASYTFNEVGEFPYICAFHPNMQAQISVRDRS